MNTTKKILLATLLVFVFSTVMAVAMAVADDNNKTADTPKLEKIMAKVETNSSFSICMKSAVDVKQTSYSAAKEAKKSCLEIATSLNTSDAKKEAGKTCSSDFKKAMKEAKKVFRADRTECLKIKHTMWEGFKANFQ